MAGWLEPGILAFAGFVVTILGSLIVVAMSIAGYAHDAPAWMVPLGLGAMVIARYWSKIDG